MIRQQSFTYIFWCLALPAMLILGTACKSSSGLGGRNKAEATLVAAKANNLIFNTMSLSGKAQVSADQMGFSMGVSYKINIQKDSLIWIKVSKFGFEGMRVLITQDSIYMLNKTDRTYQVFDFEPAKEVTGLDADFGVIQDLLLGNFHPLPESLNLLDKKASPRVYTGDLNGTAFIYHILTDINKLSQINTSNTVREQEAKIRYGEFEKISSLVLPFEVNINVSAPEKADIGLAHKKVTLNPDDITFSFEVPSNYEKMGK